MWRADRGATDYKNTKAGYISLAPAQPRAQLMRLTDFCTHHQASEVPDPYYGGEHGFEAVLDLVEDACQGLLAALRLT